MMTEDAKIAEHSRAGEVSPGGVPGGKARALRLAVVLAALAVVVAGALAALAQAGAFGNRPTTTATASPTAVATTNAFPAAAAQVPVYSADWTQGADGWTLPAGWSAQNGQLVADLTTDAEVPVPFLVVAPRYSIQLDLQGLHGNGFTGGNHFILVARDLSGKDLYELVVQCNGGSQCAGETGILIDYPAPGSDAEFFNDSYYGPGVQPFQLRMAGNELMRCVTNCDWTGTSALPLSPVHLFLISHHVQLKITHFAITIP
jgi:hypothetical protein